MNIKLIKLTSSDQKIIVIKFGSSVLSSEIAISTAVHEVYRYLRDNYKVLVVVSALGNTTNNLEIQAKKIIDDPNVNPEPQAFAELLATGENSAASLFAIALNHAGVPAIKLDHHCLHTKGPILDAEPYKLRKKHVLNLFKQYPVLVLPGFIGMAENHFVNLLGRGGSDFTAIFTAWALGTEHCVLYKDTNGIFNHDPEENHPEAAPYKKISYEDCLKISYPVVQYKAVKFAQGKKFRFRVKSIGNLEGTLVGAKTSALNKTSANTFTSSKLKVVLLGLGTVGYGVYRHLLAAKHLFDIVGIGIKNPLKHQHYHISEKIISADLQDILKRDADVVIELMGEPVFSEQCIKQALNAKRHVVSANKFLIAEKGLELSQLAEKNGVKLLYSAAVAGAVPILETLANLIHAKPVNPIKSLTGILNGTCNFILDKLSLGQTLPDAIKLAQIAGFAEADPSLDINGLDAAHKLIIISRLAFGKEIKNLDIEGIQYIDKKTISDAAKNNTQIKLIAHCQLERGNLQASVKPTVIPPAHPFGTISGAANSILIEMADGEIIQLHGKGAGRWPTAEAVFADLFDLLLEQSVDNFNHSQNDSALRKNLLRYAI